MTVFGAGGNATMQLIARSLHRAEPVRPQGIPDDQPAGLFENCESAVRSYSRAFPAVFTTAKGEFLFDRDGTPYLDFLSGAGALNYGHNPDVLKESLISYLDGDGLVHGLDLATAAKGDFLASFRDHILAPRGLNHRVQFCGPSGTNAIEAALKLARLATGRGNVVSFGGGFHGVSSGSLAVTTPAHYKQGLYQSLPNTTHVPYPDSPFGDFDSMDLLRRMVGDPSSGMEKPAAIVLETVQAEGGVYVAPVEFLRNLREFCDEHDIILVVDDIQAGCGRTGTFFSFERAAIVPDLIALSKSIGGYGFPMAVLLIAPRLDIWQPGQHNGTFRGNQLAFVAGAAAIRRFWCDDTFATGVLHKGTIALDCLRQGLAGVPGARIRGLGLLLGLDLGGVPEISAADVSKACFERGVVVETCGRNGEVLKILPPLTISDTNLVSGIRTIVDAITND
jgi:diaminobutyrate-2-oxoglutarate transaminase